MSDTTQDLILRLKLKQSIPDSGVDFQDSVLLNYLDQALKAEIVPAILGMMEEYFVVTVDVACPTQTQFTSGAPVNVGNAIPIPSSAMGMRLRDVYVVNDTSGSFMNLPRLTPSQAAAYGSGYNQSSISVNNNQYPGGFYLQGNQVMVFPFSLASGKTVRLTYQRAPADLALILNSGQVLAVTGDVLQLNNVVSWTAGSMVDVISHHNPHDYVTDLTADNVVYTSYTPLIKQPLVAAAGNVVTLPLGKGASVSVGDWVCATGTSVYAQNIPKEILPSLVQKASSYALEAAGDREGQAIAETGYSKMMAQALKMISHRVDGKPPKILATNSPFRGSRNGSFLR